MKFILKWLSVVLPLFWLAVANATPAIIITNLPAYGTFNNLGGLVLDANPASSAVAVFIYVPGYGWVTKPTCGHPLTPILPDGSWTADITSGGSDPLATRIAALLVSTNYNRPCVDGSNADQRVCAGDGQRRGHPRIPWGSVAQFFGLSLARESQLWPGWAGAELFFGQHE